MDTTTLWVWLNRHRRALGLIIPAVLLFGAGWQAGRVMSPYYAAAPIVFEDSQEISGGGAAELSELQSAGQPGEGRGEVAGTTAPSTSPVPGQFVGSVNSDLYHHADCPIRIKTENQIWFSSVEEAQAAGYKPSKCTQEKLSG